MLATYQYQAPVVGFQAPAPVVGNQPITPSQTTGGLDISSLMNTILPLMTLMMVFGMITPMFKQMGQTFQS